MTASSQPLTPIGPSIAKFLVGLGLIYLVPVWLSRATVAATHPELLAFATVFDLTITAGVLYWWTIVRPGHARLRTLIGLLALNLFLAQWLIDWVELGPMLMVLAGLGALAELTMLGVTVSRLRLVIGAFRGARAQGSPRGAALEEGLSAALPEAVASAAAAEVTLIVYAFAGWLWPTAKGDGQRVFTYHRRSYWSAVAMLFVFLVVVESVALHLILGIFYPALQIVHAVVMIYSLIWLVGDLQLLRRTPFTLDDQSLNVRVGIRWFGRLPLNSIMTVAQVASPPDEEGSLDVGLPGSPRVLVRLKEPVTFRGLYGIRRSTRVVCVGVDDPEGLVAALT